MRDLIPDTLQLRGELAMDLIALDLRLFSRQTPSSAACVFACVRGPAGASAFQGIAQHRLYCTSWFQRLLSWGGPLTQVMQEHELVSEAAASKVAVKRASPPNIDPERLRTPAQITAYIIKRQHTALGKARDSPQAAGTGFCDSMDDILAAADPGMNHINYAAVINASSRVWGALLHRLRGPNDVRDRLKTLHQRCVQQLQPRLSDMSARQISNVLLASASLGWDPDAIVPGMVQSLTVRFLQLHHAGLELQRPLAQDYADLLNALATWDHPAATPELVDLVSLHFAWLAQHPDKAQRPNGQDCTRLLGAFARLEHTAATAEVADPVCLHFALLVASASLKQRPIAQEVARLVWALGTLKHTPPGPGLLDHVCAYMHTLYHQQDEISRPNAKATAHMLWGLTKLRHAPSQDVASAMTQHLVALCHTRSSQLRPKHISSCFLACAELGFTMLPAQRDFLFNHLVGTHFSKVGFQEYSNVARSLAVMGCLHLSMFEALLHQLTTKHKLLLGSQSMSAQPKPEEARQLHQALEWLKPAQGSDQWRTWYSLRARLQGMAPKPSPWHHHRPGLAEMHIALATHNLLYQNRMPFGLHMADAVLIPCSSNGTKVILKLESSHDFVANVPNRVLGLVAFRDQILGRYGTIVTIPYDPDSSSVGSMAGAIKAAVEAKTGLPLHSFRRR